MGIHWMDADSSVHATRVYETKVEEEREGESQELKGRIREGVGGYILTEVGEKTYIHKETRQQGKGGGEGRSSFST